MASVTVNHTPSVEEGRGNVVDELSILNDIKNIKKFQQISHERDIENLAFQPVIPKFSAYKPTLATRVEKKSWKRNTRISGNKKFNNFDDIKASTLKTKAAILEASRCLKCADAPCTKGCPTQIDIKAFIQCIASGNIYGAARYILSDNPIGLSCGMVCPTSELCAGGCNLADSEGGPINIGGLQQFAVETFMKMKIAQRVHPQQAKQTAAVYSKKIAIVGSGPASLSCANFLARLGYKDISVFEKENSPGGLSTTEIPQYRLPYDAVRFEARLCQDMGVKFFYNRALDAASPLTNLRKDYAAIFLGIGLYQAKTSPVFENFGPQNRVYTSKEFLPAVAALSKPGISLSQCGQCGAAAASTFASASAGTPTSTVSTSSCASGFPFVGKHCVVVGAGDTAFDCVTSAFRCGAERVTVAFRKVWSEMRAIPEEIELGIRELADFLPQVTPHAVRLDEDGHICSVSFHRLEKTDAGGYEEDMETTFTLRCSSIITAFGCELETSLTTALSSLEISPQGYVQIRNTHQSTTDDAIFCGGDLTGGFLTVEAANDGKIAAWNMHTYLQTTYNGDAWKPPASPELPLFYTAIDFVDISVTLCGIPFINPFGLASAPCSTSAAMIRRAFEAGWAFAVTKTYTLDQHIVTNVSPRIVRGCYDLNCGPNQRGFLNIELITEKCASYWCQAIRELKHDFPDRILVASLMAPYNKEEWHELTKQTVEAGADILELNLSCPHGMGEVGMGLACGQEPTLVEVIVRWVKEICKSVPVFVKLTPNITEIALIGKAAQRGGAEGATAINTLHGIMDFNGKGESSPSVGSEKVVTSGGISGDVNRPVGLRAVSSLRKFCPGLEIMATGGISSADSGLQYLFMGATLLQVGSAIQNQDFTIIDDYCMGLKTRLYLMGRTDLQDWNGQIPPPLLDESSRAQLPNFGEFQEKKIEMRRLEVAQQANAGDTMDLSVVEEKPIKPLRIADIIGLYSNRVRMHNELNREQQVIAVIHDDLCINCGKCYMTCNDNAYQAIKFDGVTHQATIIDDKCTGCGLCGAVCPVPNCIEFVLRDSEHPHYIHRY